MRVDDTEVDDWVLEVVEGALGPVDLCHVTACPVAQLAADLQRRMETALESQFDAGWERGYEDGSYEDGSEGE